MNLKSDKRVLLLAPPFSGHLHPVLGLARSLKSFFNISIVSTPKARESIESAGLQAISILKGKDDILAGIVNPAVAIGHNPWRLYQQLQQNLSLLAELTIELQEVYSIHQPDIVLADFTLPMAGLLAEQKGIAWYTLLPSPCAYECPKGPVAYMGGRFPRADWLGQIRDRWHRLLVRSFKRCMFLLFRKQLTGLMLTSPYDSRGQERIYSTRRIFALGMKELEFDRQCPDHFELCGPILYTPPHFAPAPVFHSGCRHVLVTLGTHLLFYKERMWQALMQAAPKLDGVVIHFSYGDAQSSLTETDGNLHRYGYVSYKQHLARYDLVLHHCGAGIMYECIRQAIPALLFPIDYDQFDNAVRLQMAGAGIRLKSLKALDMAIALELKNHALRKRCQKLKYSSDQYDACKSIRTVLQMH